MESYNNLASLREMSEIQLAALLRYESPPETPSQVTQMLLSNEPSNKNDKSESSNYFLVNDCDQHASQMQSQVDFPIFHNNNTYTENISPVISPFSFGRQNRVNEESSLIFSQKSECIALSSCETPTKISNIFSYDEGSAKPKTNKSAKKNIDDDFGELDNILKSIDFQSFSGESHLHINTTSIRQKQYQSDLEFKHCVFKSNDKIVASCPVPIQNINSLNPSNINELRKQENLYEKSDLECYKENFISMKNCPLNEETPIDFKSIGNEEMCGQRYKVPTNLTMKKENLSKKKINNVALVPFSIKRLYDIVTADFSDFAFIYSLSAQLCQDRVPMECFVVLKMLLLLSLASIGNDPDRPPISVVAMSDDTYMTDYLMVNIGKLATRFVGPTGDIKPSSSESNCFEADHILLARGGVYYVGDWNRLKLKRAESIFKIIECSNVSVNNSAAYPLETSIWTHWHSFMYNSKDQQTFNKFLKIFGIPVFVCNDNHETLVDYTLEQSSIRVFESTIDHLSITEDDMRNFLVHVSQCNVNLTPGASSLLKNYFVASRSFRQDCLSQQSFTTLKQLAESFCKLSMRNEVSTDDVLAAIVLCEHSVQNIFSSCDKPPPYFGSFPFVGAVDNYLNEFKQWLDRYLNNFEK